jgi:penicillin G amidase
MRLLRLFFQYSPRYLFLAAVAGAIGGAVSAGLMAAISAKLNQLTGGTPWTPSLAIFIALVVLVLLSSYGSRTLMLHLATCSAQDLRLSLCRQVLSLPLRQFEEMGSNRVLAALTEDIAALGVALLRIPELCVSMAMLVGCFFYLGYLSLGLVGAFVLFVAMGIITTRWPEARAKQILARARADADELIRLFEEMNASMKPLKLHALRRQAFVDDFLTRAANSFRRRTFAGQHVYALTQNWGQILYFVFIGIVLYGFSRVHGIDNKILIGYTLTVMYMRQPILALLDMMPDFGRANVSLRTIERLGLSLDALGAKSAAAEPPAALSAFRDAPSVELIGVHHSYYREREESHFILGPIDLTLYPGEILFLVGGNGSGKTTLAKLITGLYVPEGGEIRCNGKVMGMDDWEVYRQNFAAIFSDFYVFDTFLGLERPERNLDREVQRLLIDLQLDHKVAVTDGALSTTSLSQGQRKRLALLTAYLEDRPIYLFDEWASDQDPLFKKVFYLELLPELKRSGKTVVAISHDDRYYEVADRIVKLEDGKICSCLVRSEGEFVVKSEAAVGITRPPDSVTQRPEENIMFNAQKPAHPPLLQPRGRSVLWRALGSLLTLVIFAAGAGALWLHHRWAETLPRLDGSLPLAGLTAPVRIERDRFGTPTVSGATRNDVGFATGFLHAQERFFQMDLLRRKAAGELAELVGRSALDEDRKMRTHRLRAVAERALARLPAADRGLLDAYTRGVNEGLRALPQLPFEYALLRARAAPWKPEDSLLTLLAMFADLQGKAWQRESALGVVYERLPLQLARFLTPSGTGWDAPLLGDAVSPPPVVGPEVFDLRHQAQAAAGGRPESGSEDAISSAESAAGSNSFALAGARTADGGALLANDLHLELMIPNLWYRTSLAWAAGVGEPQSHRVTGVTLPGLPFTIIGSNGHLAWGLTNLEGDTSDLVRIETVKGHPEVYLTPSGPRTFGHITERIAVQGGSPEILDVTTTVWGPVVGRDPAGDPEALAWVAHREEAVDLRFLAMERAKDIAEGIAIANRSGLPALNVLLAGADGRIAWTVTGKLPRRTGLAGPLPASWADGASGWNGWIEPAEYPRLIDPPAAQLWTANNRPVDGAGLTELGDGGYVLGARARQIRDDLSRLQRATPRDMLGILLDDRAVFLDRWRELLLRVLTPAALEGSAERRDLRRRVEHDWSGQASPGSTGYRIVHDYREVVQAEAIRPLIANCKKADPQFRFPTQQSEGPLWKLLEEKPLNLLSPRYKSWDELLLHSVDLLLQDYRGGEHPPLDTPWGTVNEVLLQHPLSQAIPLLGRWLDMPPAAVPGDDNMPRVQHNHFGASVRMVVSPGREGAGFLHMPGGQSGNPLSPHYGDQQDDWLRGMPTPFLPGKIEHTLTLLPSAGRVLPQRP